MEALSITNPSTAAPRMTESDRPDTPPLSRIDALIAEGEGLAVAENVRRFDYGDEPDQFLEVHGDPASASAVLVFVHGGYFRPRTDLTHARPTARALAEAGVLVVLVEYRRVGGQPRCLDDVTAAIDFTTTSLETWGVAREAREDLVIAGHSAGGCLVLSWASHLGEDGPPVLLFPLAPVTDLLREVELGLGDGAVLDYMGLRPEEDLVPYLREDPRSRVSRIPDRVAVHIIHGDADETVDVGFSRTFPAPLTVLEGADHFDVIDPASPHFTNVRNWMFGRASAATGHPD